jgi:hypothetical protein
VKQRVLHVFVVVPLRLQDCASVNRAYDSGMTVAGQWARPRTGYAIIFISGKSMMNIQEMPMGTVEVFSSTFVRVETVKADNERAFVLYKKAHTDHVVLEIELNNRGESEIKRLDKFFWNILLDGMPTSEAEMAQQDAALQFNIGAESRVINFRSN